MSRSRTPLQQIMDKLLDLNWFMLILLCALAAVGITALYSAGDGFDSWAGAHAKRFALGLVGVIIVALIDIRYWYRLAYPFYIISFIALVVVEVEGKIGMGAQRWINLGFVQLQPSELMKIGVALALARWFHARPLSDTVRLPMLLPPLGLIMAPMALVLLQPDLGTAGTIGMLGGFVMFLSGMRLKHIAFALGTFATILPLAWHFLHDYQKRRLLIFTDETLDPMGAGYHIRQSKIALGAGGFDGRGFMLGSQSHLNFLPERHTDFIFTLWAEEWGMLGGLMLLTLYALLFLQGHLISLSARSHFGRLLAIGLTVNLFIYVAVNIGMVMGLLPVVGVPLPLISYGGSVMLTVLFACGLQMSVWVHREIEIGRIRD